MIGSPFVVRFVFHITLPFRSNTFSGEFLFFFFTLFEDYRFSLALTKYPPRGIRPFLPYCFSVLTSCFRLSSKLDVAPVQLLKSPFPFLSAVGV